MAGEGRGREDHRGGRSGIARAAAGRVGLPSLLLASSAPVALAAVPGIPFEWRTLFSPDGAVGFAAVLGLLVFTTTTAIVYVRERGHWQARQREQSAAIEAAETKLARLSACLGAEPQVVLSWQAQGEPRTDIDGAPEFLVVGGQRVSPLAFGLWASPDDARALDGATDRLRAEGEAFHRLVRSRDGRYVEAAGRPVAGRAVLHLREVSAIHQELHRERGEKDALQAEAAALRAMVEEDGLFAWRRDGKGRIAWVNAAYARAVEAADPADAALRGLELLGQEERQAAAASRADGRPYAARATAIVAGSRHVLDIRERPVAGGFAGLALDVSEVEAVRTDLQREMAAHVRTLDRLPTAVAAFDGRRRLAYCNPAYQRLWGLPPSYLAGQPSDGEILDRLRADSKLPEMSDHREWRAALFAAYSAMEPHEDWWYLPDGRTLHVTANPNPQGGVTYLFDDATERFSLESQVKSLARDQSETLDNLSEGVAVFGSDGRLKLANPAFAEAWKIPQEVLKRKPHIDEVLGYCMALHGDPASWEAIRGAIVGVHDRREGTLQRMPRADGSVMDVALAPLPEAATLLTFTDVTASVNVERALTERNEALEIAARLRDDFVHHFSYELRSPLTTIIGFAQIMGEGMAGPLTPQQKDYAQAILRSSGTLLAILNDILDLASIDNDALRLEISEVDLRETVQAAVRGLDDRLAEARIVINIDVDAEVARIRADGQRLRQVIYNLLSNAVGFSDPGQSVDIAAVREGEEVVISVRDHGRGIPDEVRNRVFRRFESHTLGSRHRGVGLGLSIVRSLVELHGGSVSLESGPGEGTRVVCRLPLNPEAPLADAAE